jgi:predicted RecB family nuclease
MKLTAGQIRLAATDLGNHLACRHLTTLDLQVAHGKRAEPEPSAPDLKVIQELGLRHQRDYLAHLTKQGLNVKNLEHIPYKEEERLLAETLALMEKGAQVIAQGALSDGKCFGRPDVLLRVATPSKKWPWSYEVQDTKLAKETKATTILQLSLYSELLEKIQGTLPESLWVIPPGHGFKGEKYPVLEYAAYFRLVRKRLLKAVGEEPATGTYPEPIEHCTVCRWFRECDNRRRSDDHLSLVAGIRRQQRDQFEEWNAGTMAKLAALPIPLKERPKHGSKAGYERAMKQARIQVRGRVEKKHVHEPILPVVESMGFCRLPEPAALLQVFILRNLKPFGINTYEKHGEGWSLWLIKCSKRVPDGRVRRNRGLPFSVHTSKFRIPQPLCLPLLRKTAGV